MSMMSNGNGGREKDASELSRMNFRDLKPLKMDPELVDDLLTHEMENLSFKARNEIYEELHGVASLDPEETPEMVQQSIKGLNQEIDRIKHKYTAYNKATKTYNPYVHGADIRLRFLRCDLFDIPAAAKRMLGYLDLTRELFGDVVLTRPIELRDLGKQEMEMLREGDAQPMPFRDRSGRRVMVAMDNMGLQYPLEVRIRVSLYLFWTISEDKESQRKGLIGILCWPSRKEAEAPKNFAFVYSPMDVSRHIHLSNRMFECSPVRISGLHMCFPDKRIFHMLKAGMALSLGGSKTRMKAHCGDSMEIQYHLHGYGIPVDQIPITDTGNIKTKNLIQWIRVRKHIEETRNKDASKPCGNSDSESSVPSNMHLKIDCPNMNDVIFRGKHANLSHPGNSMFRGLIESKYEEHTLLTTTDAKVQLTWSIMNEVEKKNGRFLTWDNSGCWRIMTDRLQIRSKVAGALKDHKRRLKARKNLQDTRSSTYQFGGHQQKKRKVNTNKSSDERFCFNT